MGYTSATPLSARTRISGDEPAIFVSPKSRKYRYGEGLITRKARYRLKRSPLNCAVNRCERTTWKISPSVMYFFAAVTIFSKSSRWSPPSAWPCGCSKRAGRLFGVFAACSRWTRFPQGVFVLCAKVGREIDQRVDDDDDLVPQMVERDDLVEQAQDRILEPRVVYDAARELLDGPHGVVADETHQAAREPRERGVGRLAVLPQQLAQQAEEVAGAFFHRAAAHQFGRLAAGADQEQRVPADEGIPRDPLAALHALQQERGGALPAKPKVRRDRADRVGQQRLAHRDHLVRPAQLLELFIFHIGSRSVSDTETQRHGEKERRNISDAFSSVLCLSASLCRSYHKISPSCGVQEGLVCVKFVVPVRPFFFRQRDYPCALASAKTRNKMRYHSWRKPIPS